MRKIRGPYRQGVINTDNHPIYKKGQIVEIVGEFQENYKVRTFLTGKVEEIKKEYISLE